MRGFARSAIQAIECVPAASPAITDSSNKNSVNREVRVVSENGSHLVDDCEERKQQGGENHSTQTAVAATEEEDAWISDLGSIMEDFTMPHYHTTDCMDGFHFTCMPHANTTTTTATTTATATGGHSIGNINQEARKHHHHLHHCASQNISTAPYSHSPSLSVEESGVGLSLYTPLLFAHDKIATGWDQHLVPSSSSPSQLLTDNGVLKSEDFVYHTISNELDGSNTESAKNGRISLNTTRMQNPQIISPVSGAENRALTSPPACCGGHRKNSFDIGLSGGKKQKI